MRADLLALTKEGVAALANMGLVKRAEREIAAGQGPALAEEADGTVVGTFADGVVARLPPRTELRACPCTCGATGVCRHRVAVALAYPAFCGDAAPAPALPPVDDDALTRALGARTVDTARALVARGILVTVEEDAVRLPTCTVRFLVPNDLAYARCDCAQAKACEHVAVAVWALRERRGTFELRRGRAGGPGVTADDDALLEDLEALAADVLRQGASHAGGAFAERLAGLRRRAEAMTWIVLLLEDVERLLEAYAARSARYDEKKLVALLAELAARSRAARAPGAELPRRYVLGLGEAKETLLEQVRLVSLGARLDADGRVRRAEVYLADPDSGTVMVLEREWTYAEGEDPEVGPALAKRTVAARVHLGMLAHGQVISRAVKRRANLQLTLGSRAGATALMPGHGELGRLPPSILVRSYRELRERLREQPPRLLRPRILADGMVVLAVASVLGVAYAPARQELRAVLADADGDTVHLVVEHRNVAPHALSALSRALHEGARFVTGRVRWEGGALVLDPAGIATEERFVVPDLAGPEEAPALETAGVGRAQDALDGLLASVGHALAEVAHHGLTRRPPSLAGRVAALAARCQEAGLLHLGARVGTLAERLVSGDAAAAWLDASIRWEVAVGT